VVADFNTRFGADFEPMELPVLPTLAPAAALTIWPQDMDGNGMFIAGWRRKK
jgi:hypothetical protein